MCSKQKRIFKSKCFQHNYKNKWIENINKAYRVNINVNLTVKNVTQIKIGITLNIDVSVNYERTSCVQKKLFLESWFMLL